MEEWGVEEWGVEEGFVVGGRGLQRDIDQGEGREPV